MWANLNIVGMEAARSHVVQRGRTTGNISSSSSSDSSCSSDSSSSSYDSDSFYESPETRIHICSPAKNRTTIHASTKQMCSMLQPCTYSNQAPNLGAKRARTRSPPDTNIYWRDWANLVDGPAGLIAERLLIQDVADYLRFRIVCRPWRQCCTESRAHASLDRRFHPRQWILLQEPHAPTTSIPPSRQRFLNTSTSECIQMDLPELHDHQVLALTCEGLLVLLSDRNHVRLLNPLTRHLTLLPPLTETMLPTWFRVYLPTSGSSYRLGNIFREWSSGILNDDSTVVLCFRFLGVIWLAKPGDVCWKHLKFNCPLGMTSTKFAGRFYFVTRYGLKVLEDQPPRLDLAAKLPFPMMSTDSVHLVDCDGELMLVHRKYSRRHIGNSVYKRRYDMYRVELDAGTMCQVTRFGGGRHALFIGMYCCLSVPIEVFPSGSIRGETIYLSFDLDERKQTEGYYVTGRRLIRSCNLDGHWVAQPCTLADCLSLCCTSRPWK